LCAGGAGGTAPARPQGCVLRRACGWARHQRTGGEENGGPTVVRGEDGTSAENPRLPSSSRDAGAGLLSQFCVTPVRPGRFGREKNGLAIGGRAKRVEVGSRLSAGLQVFAVRIDVGATAVDRVGPRMSVSRCGEHWTSLSSSWKGRAQRDTPPRPLSHHHRQTRRGSFTAPHGGSRENHRPAALVEVRLRSGKRGPQAVVRPAYITLGRGRGRVGWGVLVAMNRPSGR